MSVCTFKGKKKIQVYFQTELSSPDKGNAFFLYNMEFYKAVQLSYPDKPRQKEILNGAISEGCQFVTVWSTFLPVGTAYP